MDRAGGLRPQLIHEISGWIRGAAHPPSDRFCSWQATIEGQSRVIRLAGVADAGAVLAMMREYYVFDRLDFDEAAARAALEGLLAAPALGEVWLAEEDDVALGYAVLCLGWSLEFHGRDAFVDEIFVVEGARGIGLGRRLLEQLEARCRVLGVRALHLEVDRENHRALEVYRAAGFVDHERFLLTKRIA